MSVEMSEKDSKCINNYYMIISNIERIGDHAMNIAEYLKSLKMVRASPITPSRRYAR